MSKTIIVAGYGPGISHAVAEKFGNMGFSVGLVARNEARLNDAAGQLKAKGIRAAGFPADVGNLDAMRSVVQRVRTTLGPISAIHWNAAASMAGDILTAPVEQLRAVFDVAVSGLVVTVQESLADLKKAEKPAVLVTNGGFGLFDTNIDSVAVRSQSMALAIGNSAKHKTVRLLAKRLEPEGIYVAEVMVLGTVKGTAWDKGQATLQASDIANRFWQLYEKRNETLVQFS